MIEIKLKKVSFQWKWFRKKPITLTTKLELYESIKELTAERQNEYNKLAFRDIGVGSTLQDFNKHFSQLHAYLKNDKTEDALMEMSNIYKNFFYAINKISIWSYCFCAFIKSIDGKEYDRTELGDHKRTIEDLSKKGLTSDQCKSTLDAVKKNLTQNFDPTFLGDIMTAEVLTYYQKLKDIQ